MRVKIGPYKSWIGPYQLTGWIKRIFGEKRYDKFTDSDFFNKFSDFVMPACTYVEKKRKRSIRIQIDKYDTWSADNTLSHIAVPLLEQLRDKKQGSPIIEDEDLPEYLQSVVRADVDFTSGDQDDLIEARWNWIMNEIIWALTEHRDDTWEEMYYDRNVADPGKTLAALTGEEIFAIIPPARDAANVDFDGRLLHDERIQRGMELFGKYFRSMWT